jgi:hypothetical protein
VLDRTSKVLSLKPSSNVAIHFVESTSREDIAAAWLLQARTTLDRPLTERGMVTSHGLALLPGAINLATAASLSRLWLPYFRSFMVGLRCDQVALAQCDWEIVPTGLDLARARRSVIAPWTSATTLARSSTRLDRVANLTFFSVSPAHSRWRAASGQVEQLMQQGVACRIEPAALDDLSDTDVLVADCAELRQHGGSFLSPLIAAWRAGIPAILIESDQERLERTSALDYLSISGPEQLVAQLAGAKSHPQLYESMRQRAAFRARELRDNLITERWVQTLADLIAPQAQLILQQRRNQPVRAMSLQAGRWLVQQGRRRAAHGSSAATRNTR